MEQLVAFVILVNTLLVGFMVWGLFKFFPHISRANIHRATTDQHLEIAARSMDPLVSEDMAATADVEARDKPLGVDATTWEQAILLADEQGCTVDQALNALQAEDPNGDAGPRV